jgi:hypothetical protein
LHGHFGFRKPDHLPRFFSNLERGARAQVNEDRSASRVDLGQSHDPVLSQKDSGEAPLRHRHTGRGRRFGFFFRQFEVLAKSASFA